ncbi:extracellular solute-binding protein [Flexivirga sp. ID2601S]|uniref:Extracellular solute-binding protein n=1 Tax=Flexivirga aerilata TaxID=1656889 RepID=A0A849APW1_9MICO|nr:extracellular solute-binding protein [Flexivirga aerilata]NNG38812.1 extracellular solute-binding protein [Flexivirga aerilata]
MSEFTRRSALGIAGVGTIAALTAGFPRLTGRDIPGRGSDDLTVAILGTAQDAAARQGLLQAFHAEHPDIPVRFQAIQGADWSDFFAKVLTLVAAGTPPDVVMVATEGAQLFADRLAEPLDSYVLRDADVMQDYFSDVHPALVEAFMYRGHLYQVPGDFNAADMYLNLAALRRAGLERPADDWTKDDFHTMLRAIKRTSPAGTVPFYWTNRLWGGVVPWLYANDTSILKQTQATGGEWLWKRFYSGDPAAAGRAGGPLWLEPNALDPRVEETFDFLRRIVAEGLGSSPAQGGGDTLVPQFASGRVGMTPAGGYWVQGLHEAGMPGSAYDVQFFPRWRSQRAQFGAAGYAIMRTSHRKDEAWEWIKFCTTRRGMQLSIPDPNTTPTRRSLVDAALYRGKGPAHWRVFYDTLDKFPGTGPIPAPPQQAAVETALIKNVVGAVTGSAAGTRGAMHRLQDDLSTALGSDR